MGKQFKIRCKKKVILLDSQEDVSILHIEGKEYRAWEDEFRNIYTTDESETLHRIADYTDGGLKDQWFVEYFEVLEIIEA